MSQQHPELSPSRASLQQLLRARLAGPAQHPCSFGQQRLWFLERLAPGLPTYNLPVAAQLEGPLDEGALLEELRQLVRRHEILRTTFAETAEGVVQRAAPGMDADVELVDLSGEGDAAARALVEAEALRPFDLAAGPPFRARVIRCAPDRHFLLLCQHHITGDAASVGVLLRELSAGYAARVRGDAQPAPPRLQYADFAEWERRHLRGPDRERLLAYWRERLAGVPTDAAHRPAGAPRGPGRSARHPFELTPEATAALAGLAREEGSTTSMPVLAGFAALLSRFTERRDLVIGVPVSGRTRSEFEETVGFFVNTLPVRIRLEGNPTFREALRRVRDAVLGGVEHQEMPLDLLVQELRISSEGGGSPLVQVAFSPADEFPSGLELPGIVSRAWWPETGIAKFDLFLRFTDDPDGAGAALLYDTNLFDAETIARLAGQLVALLGAAAADPDRRIADVPLLSPEERERVVVEWNRTAADFPRGRCVHDLFAAQAALTPDALALDGDSGALSYGQLETRANRLAHLLRARGVGVETRVGVLLERGPELIVALLAVLKAGGAYVPLDPEYPAERLAFMLRDSGAALLVSDATLSARGADLPCAVVRVDDDALDGFPATPPAAVTDAENLAYVVYTSGSTGTPKGVMVSHEALANLCAWHARAFDVGPDARATLVASVGFDASAWELWPYLMRGASVRAVPAALRLAPAELGRWMETERVTHAFLPTPLAEALLAESTAGPSAWLLTGGDRMRRAPSAREFRVANNYGPTESTVVATSVELRAGAAGEPPIGRPIANTRGYVLDSGLQPVPIGAWGELYLGGAQLARGYLARPALTAASFVPDPFSGQPGARLYRTGDRVRWTAEGVLEFGGRVDEQVKVRGHRIEPGEVEAALLSHPDVAEAAVAALGEGDEKRLVAYVVPRTGAGTDAAREHLRERLPAYMVPSAFVVLDRLPLTPNGKVDRRALPAPSPGETRTAPRTPTEEVLAGIWCDVLGVERVGMEDDFFELGGHSMRAMRIAARVGEALGVEVPLRTLFEHSTLAALAARADVLRRGGEAPARIQPRRDGAAAPLSFGQERLYFLQRLAPESTAYHVPTALRLAGDLDLRALADALAEVVRRHEILRSRFAERDGAPVQLPLPPRRPRAGGGGVQRGGAGG
jgi:amino acid adenylation domain-containing protein